MSEPAAAQPIATDQPVPRRASSGVGAALIGAGILLSRVIGLARQALIARYLGAGIAADAFNAAFRIPNFLQNMFGDGALSAAFVPVYSSLLGKGEEDAARKLAGSVAALLGLVTAALVLLGIVFAPQLVETINPGFAGDRLELAIYLTRILFPGAGIFVLSAWSLGVLSSHRRFFLGYVAPVAWNGAMIACLLWFGPRGTAAGQLAVYLAVASVIGALLQVVVQLPLSLKLVGGLKARIVSSEPLRQVRRGFAPVAVSRGAVQVSAFIDQSIASLLPIGAVTMVNFAQTIYMLPVSLFGMSVSAAELTEMSREAAPGEAASRRIAERLERGLKRIAYFVVPSAIGFIAVGDVIIGALLRSGRFGAVESRFTWGILGAAAIGLLAATLSRLYSSTFYALNDTKTPFRIALVRIVIGTGLAALLALVVTPRLGIDGRWGAAGLTLGSAVAGWVELVLLQRQLGKRIGEVRLPGGYLLRLLAASMAGAAAGIGLKLLTADLHRFLVGGIVVGGFALVYVAVTAAAGVGEARQLVSRVAKRLRR